MSLLVGPMIVGMFGFVTLFGLSCFVFFCMFFVVFFVCLFVWLVVCVPSFLKNHPAVCMVRCMCACVCHHGVLSMCFCLVWIRKIYVFFSNLDKLA